MINTYTFFPSDVNKLNEFVLAFFNKIEFETGVFSNTFFETEFYDNLVKRHKGILLKSFKSIYEITKTWNQSDRTAFCKSIKQSNEIEAICEGKIIPTKATSIRTDISQLLVELFKKLYSDVLFGDFFKPHYGNRKTHYHAFRKHAKNEFEFCPACGISAMHNSVDDITDQYDHYLPKDIYPFSSVNFQNLVPICRDCNSIEVKSNADVLTQTGKAFYPFNPLHKPISFGIKIAKNSTDIEKIEWDVDYTAEFDKSDELEAWKTTFKIQSRHKSHVAGNIKSWYKYYWEDVTDSTNASSSLKDRKQNYLKTKERRHLIEYNALKAYLDILETSAFNASVNATRYP
jgi:hypothetical protein